MRVTVSDGRQIIGRFMAFDRHLNLVLGDAEEYRLLPPKKGSGGAPQEARRVLGLVLLRGEEVISLTVEGPPPVEDRQARGAPVPGPGVGRPAGRGMPLAAAAPPTAPGAPPPGLGGAARGVGAPSPAMMAPRPPGMPPMMGGGMPGMPPPPMGESFFFVIVFERRGGAPSHDGPPPKKTTTTTTTPETKPTDGRTDRGGRESSEVETRFRCRQKVLSKGESRIPGRAISGDGKKKKKQCTSSSNVRGHISFFIQFLTPSFSSSLSIHPKTNPQQEARRRLTARRPRPMGLPRRRREVRPGSERESAFFFLLE
jgi:small nuclear ribonucleoprotein B and B'